MEYVLAVHAADRTRCLIPLPAQGSLLIGREAPADVVIPDSFLSRSHVRLDCHAGLITFTDGGSRNGTLLNGTRAKQGTLRHGDCLLAGRSFFRLSSVINGKVALPLLSGSPKIPLLAEQLTMVDSLSACAFAVLDGAVDPAVYTFLKQSGAFFQSLYEGEPAVPIAPSGPFLVDLTSSPEFLPPGAAGLAEGMGIFLKSAGTFEQVRHHLRSLLLTQAEDGKTLLFRFYDPRVLNLFVPTCTPAQRVEFFGSIAAVLLLKEQAADAQWLLPSGERSLSSERYLDIWLLLTRSSKESSVGTDR